MRELCCEQVSIAGIGRLIPAEVSHHPVNPKVPSKMSQITAPCPLSPNRQPSCWSIGWSSVCNSPPAWYGPPHLSVVSRFSGELVPRRSSMLPLSPASPYFFCVIPPNSGYCCTVISLIFDELRVGTSISVPVCALLENAFFSFELLLWRWKKCSYTSFNLVGGSGFGESSSLVTSIWNIRCRKKIGIFFFNLYFCRRTKFGDKGTTAFTF